jgi:Arc/MetJ-type ribon-helix-helix transcriptional regulator
VTATLDRYCCDLYLERMDVSLTPEQERLINEAMRSGQYRDTTEVLDDALHALEQKHRKEPVSIAERQEAIERLRTFGKRHALSLESGVTVKDLIDEGRR